MLPILEVDDIEEAINIVASRYDTSFLAFSFLKWLHRPSPLVIYVFTNREEIKQTSKL